MPTIESLRSAASDAPVLVLDAETPTNGVGAGWGLDAPAGSPAVWGARAIDDRDTFGTLRDRQGIVGDPGAVAALIDLLNNHGALAHAQKVWAVLKRQGEVQRDEGRRVVLIDHPVLRIEADTNASHGYVYVVAYLHVWGAMAAPSKFKLAQHKRDATERGPPHRAWNIVGAWNMMGLDYAVPE